jgi:3-deoxy-7-phosphoheptulonate synthase
VILRGGKAPNYGAVHVAAAVKELETAKLPPRLMVDCSHANSGKQHEKQLEVARDIAAQIEGGSHHVFGLMLESHIEAGAQKFTAGKDDVTRLNYGQSITDACLGWSDSEQALALLSQAVSRARQR